MNPHVSNCATWLTGGLKFGGMAENRTPLKVPRPRPMRINTIPANSTKIGAKSSETNDLTVHTRIDNHVPTMDRETKAGLVPSFG